MGSRNKVAYINRRAPSKRKFETEKVFPKQQKIEERVCCVVGCVNNAPGRSSGEIVFHSFPTNPNNFKTWISFTKQNDDFIPNCDSYICNSHFLKSDYTIDIGKDGPVKQLKKRAFPTVYSAFEEPVEEVTIESYEIHVPEDETKTITLAGVKENKQTLNVVYVDETGELTSSEVVQNVNETYESDDNNGCSENYEADENEGEDNYDDGDENSEFKEMEEMENDSEMEELAMLSSADTDSDYEWGTKGNNQVASLKKKLTQSRKKVKSLLQMKRRYAKKISELKKLLRLLVYKRGKGRETLTDLLNEYDEWTEEDEKPDVMS